LKINIEQISEKPIEFSGEEKIENFPALLELNNSREPLFKGPLRFKVKLERESGRIRMSGEVSVVSAFFCSRCLSEFETKIFSVFTIYYTKEICGEINEETEIELDGHDLVSATYKGDEIDFGHELEEQVIMEIPVKPLCSESCKGLCPGCGEDMNHSVCFCTKAPVNMKFSALKDFKINR